MPRKYKNRLLPRGVSVDKKGYVHVRIFHNNEEVYRKEFGKAVDSLVLDDAIVKCQELKQQLRQGRFGIESVAERMTINSACDLFYKIHASKRRTAYNFNIYLLKIKSVFHNRYLDTFNKLDTECLRVTLKRDNPNIQESSINRYHTVFTSVFHAMKKWPDEKLIKPVKLPPFNPGNLVKLFDERRFIRKRIVSVVEFERFMDCAPIHIRRICSMAVNTLLRKGDLERLTKSKNVNLDIGALVGFHAKVQETSGEIFTIPITPVIMDTINKSDGDVILDFTNFRRELNTAISKAGIQPFVLKDLRKTGARMMLANGVDIDTVRKYLGHTDIETTQRYVGGLEEDKRKAANILSSLYSYKGKEIPTEQVVAA